MNSNIIRWGVQDLITEAELRLQLAADRPLKVKLGVDPTSPDLHLGHAVVLRKLRQFQQAGHETYLVIGDFTASIGDPSGANKTRPVLTEGEIKANLETYLQQAGLILDLQLTKVVYNSEWLQMMTVGQLIGFAMQISVTTLTQREDFAARLKAKQSLGFHELFYPLTQAIDSVHLEIDVEIGGWDQRLNMLLGRELQKKLGKQPQSVVAMKPLLGLDGERKMSKSFRNFIALSAPADQMFGALMSLPDKLTPMYAELAALMSGAEQKKLSAHPREAKATVARRIVALYHGEDEASRVEAAFNRTFRDKKVDPSLAESKEYGNPDLTVLEAVVIATHESRSEARRLIEQRAVKINDKVFNRSEEKIDLVASPFQLQVGRHRFFTFHFNQA